MAAGVSISSIRRIKKETQQKEKVRELLSVHRRKGRGLKPRQI